MTKEVKIQRLWHGVASVRDYLVFEAIYRREDLLITLLDTGEQMRIPVAEIESSIKKYNEEVFESKHDGRAYSLIDFEWKPTQKQKSLL